MSRVGYYPGCALKGTSREYDISIRKVNELFDVELVEIDDWNCCGASSAHMTNYKLNIALNTRNLLLAEEQGFSEVMAPCPLCSRVMIDVHQQLLSNQELLREMNEVLEKEYHLGVSVINYLQFVERYYLPVFLENPLNSPFAFDVMRQKRKFLFQKHFYSQWNIIKKPEGLKFKIPYQPDFIKASVTTNGIHQCYMKRSNMSCLVRDFIFLKRNLAESIHHVGRITLLGTPGSARLTRHTIPDTRTTNEFLPPTHLHHFHNLMYRGVHLISHRTSSCTFPAVITIPHISPGKLANLISKFFILSPEFICWRH